MKHIHSAMVEGNFYPMVQRQANQPAKRVDMTVMQFEGQGLTWTRSLVRCAMLADAANDLLGRDSW